MIPLHDDNPTTLKPVITVGLISMCALAFLWQLSLGPNAGAQAVFSLGMVPAVLFGRAELPPDIALVSPEITVLTSMFLHGGWMHLIGNMLYLWIFGNNIEDAMGRGRFVVFYGVCGAAAALAQALQAPDSTVPMIGASGAVSGVLGAYLLLYPRARVMVLIFLGIFSRIVYLPALLVLGFWFVLQAFNAYGSGTEEGGVAWWAHIGGFVAGMALIPFLRRPGFPLLGQRKGPWS